LIKHLANVIIDLLVSFGVLSAAITMPAFETGALISLVMALLGLGGLRTYEKRNGLTS
jgi:hypothetical protein